MNSGFVVWLTGLPATGKTTIAKELRKRLGNNVIILDGDEIRRKFYPNLGFSKEEREFHNKVVVFLAKFLSEELGYIVIVSLVSPLKKVREFARSKINRFLEVYLKADINTLKRRKPHIYKDSSVSFYEEGNPDLVIDTSESDIDEAVNKIIAKIREMGWL